MIKLAILSLMLSCQSPSVESVPAIVEEVIVTGADRLAENLASFKGKRIAIVGNQTSLKGGQHILDYLLENDIDVRKVMTPEHGFRGKADAGEKVNSQLDSKTGTAIISLYGSHKKPTPEDLAGIDLVIFDLQDVGLRFYTYISTLHYVMEACAENGVELMVLDRPNPNAHYIAGPVLEPGYKSFVGMHPVPVVYGMTIGEYAQMINGEAWLANGLKADLLVIPCQNYTHESIYELPVKPSPNLPNLRSILLYPTLCFFEGTNVSIGRGTNTQFQVIGSPILEDSKDYQFEPVKMEGAKYPKHENEICFGDDLTAIAPGDLHAQKRIIEWERIIEYYALYKSKNEAFFLENNFFNKLAGNETVMQAIKDGATADELRDTFKSDLEQFKKVRSKYLLYP